MLNLRIDNFLSEVTGDEPQDIPNLELLREFFSVKDPDYYQKVKKAAGKYTVEKNVYFYTSSRKLRTGLLPALVVFLEQYGLKLGRIEDLRVGMPVPLLKDDRTYTYGHTMEDHQVRCVDSYDNLLGFPTLRGTEYIPFYRGIIDAVVNAGKTLMMMGAIDFYDWGDRQPRALVTVTKGALASQHYKDFKAFFPTVLYKKGIFIPRDTCVIVSTVQALQAAINAGEPIPEHNMLLIDECHEVSSATYTNLLNLSTAPVRLGFSGTPFNNSSPISKYHTIGNLGAVLQKVEYKTLEDKGISRKLKAFIYTYEPESDTLASIYQKSYEQQMQDYIYEGKQRADVILALVRYYMEYDAKILITFDRLAHGSYMYKRLQEVVKEDRIVFTHGKDRASTRKIAQYADDGYKNILLISSIARQGLNLQIDVIFNAEGGKSTKQARQWAGRGVRRKEGTEDCILIDFMDQSKHLYLHSVSRIEAYKNEGYEVQLMYPVGSKSKYKPVTTK